MTDTASGNAPPLPGSRASGHVDLRGKGREDRKAAMTPTRTLLAVSAVLTFAPVPCGWADALATAPRIATPLLVTDAPHPEYATPLTLDGGTYARLSRERQVVVTGFPLDGATLVDLALERFEVFSPDAQIVRASARGEEQMERPDVVLLGGEVVGEPGSTVFLGLSPHGTNGVIRSAAGRHIISSGRFGTGASTVIYNLDNLPEGAIDFQGFECGLDQLVGFEPLDPGALLARLDVHVVVLDLAEGPSVVVIDYLLEGIQIIMEGTSHIGKL